MTTRGRVPDPGRASGDGVPAAGTGPPPPAAARRTDEVRIWRFTFDRLALRLAVGVALLVVLPLAGGLYLLSRRHLDRAIEARHRAAELENRILEAALRHRMVERDPTVLATTLREIAAQPEVTGAMILDHDGEIRIASDPSRVGVRLARDSPACLVCHAKGPSERERWVLLDPAAEGGARTLRSVQPIRNDPVCHECHDPNRRLNGILILDVSLADVEAAERRDRSWMVVSGAALAVLLMGGVGIFVRRAVLRRLAALRRSARSMAEGNFDERVGVGGNDVIGALAGDFNHMAESVSGLLAEVRQQEARLADVVNSLEDGLVVLDADSRIVACNRSFARRLDVRAQDARGLPCREAGRGDLPCRRGGAECPTVRCVATGEVQRAVFPVPASGGGRARVEEVYASPVLDAGGRVSQVVEIWRDITERVEEEERLAEIERLVSLGVLASGFSHEVNTPLATMLASAESILGRLDDSPGGVPSVATLRAVHESAGVVRRQVLRCRRVTESFLRFSRGIPPSVEPIDLWREVDEVVSLVHPTARESSVAIRVRPDGNGAPPSVRANAEVVRHVLLNLLVNAVQSCEGRGGEIDVESVHDQGDGRADGVRGVTIGIRDTGCGIAPEDRRHLFEPFRSRKREGTGLGLFLSRSFMRRFGGDVVLARSEVGQGSCFHVVFARAECEEEVP